MNNLTILNRQTTVNAVQEINGNTANFSWTKTENEDIVSINFYVQRSKAGEQDFTGNTAISGEYYPKTYQFDVRNINAEQIGLDIYAELLAVCKGIAADNTARPVN